MSVMDKLKQMLKGHESQAEKGGDSTDERTGGKHRKHVDTAQDKLKGRFGHGGEQREDRPPQ